MIDTLNRIIKDNFQFWQGLSQVYGINGKRICTDLK